MSPKTTGILALVALLLGGFVYFVEIGGETQRKAEEQTSLRLFPELEPESITAIRFETQDGIDARFVRRDEGWVLPELDDAPADATALGGLASALAGLAREGRVDGVETGADGLARFGLGKGAEEIAFEANGRSMRLRLGGTTPVGGFRYVSPDDLPSPESMVPSEVSFVESFRLNGFRRRLLDFRDRELGGGSLTGLEAFEVAWPGASLQIEKAGDTFRIVQPVDEGADEETVRDLLNDLSFLRANGFVDMGSPEAVAQAEAALEDLAFEIRFRDASSEARRIRIGGPYGEGRVARGPTGILATIPAERLDDFPRSLSAYRDRRLSIFEPSEARRLKLVFSRAALGSEDSGGKDSGVEGASVPREPREIEAVLESDGWRGGSPGIDRLRAADLVSRLSNLRADSVVAEEAGESERAAMGLFPPRVRFVVRRGPDVSTAALADVSLGRFDSERGVYAQKAGDPKIYLVDPSVETALPLSWQAYESRFSVEREDDAEDPPEVELDPGMEDRD